MQSTRRICHRILVISQVVKVFLVSDEFYRECLKNMMELLKFNCHVHTTRAEYHEYRFKRRLDDNSRQFKSLVTNETRRWYVKRFPARSKATITADWNRIMDDRSRNGRRWGFLLHSIGPWSRWKESNARKWRLPWIYACTDAIPCRLATYY